MISITSLITIIGFLFTFTNGFQLRVRHSDSSHNLAPVSVGKDNKLVIRGDNKPADFIFNGKELEIAGTGKLVFVSNIDGTAIASNKNSSIGFRCEGFTNENGIFKFEGKPSWADMQDDGSYIVRWTNKESNKGNEWDHIPLVVVE